MRGAWLTKRYGAALSPDKANEMLSARPNLKPMRLHGTESDSEPILLMPPVICVAAML